MKNFNENIIDGYGNFDVKLRKNETFESLVRRFLKKSKKERIVEEILDRKHYKKSTTRRREAKFRKNSVLTKLREKQLEDNNE